MLKTVRTNFDRRELRRDRRYLLPRIVVTIDGHDHATTDWSLGGFQINDGLSLAIGTAVAGTIRIEGATKTYRFTARVIRTVGEPQGVGFHFEELSADLFTALDRAISRRHVGRS